jgi:hypothetical protein
VPSTALVLGVFGGEAGTLGLDPGKPSVSEVFLPARPACPRCWAMPAALLHLLHEIFLDLAPPLRGMRQRGKLLVVGLPAVGIEQPLGFPIWRFCVNADVGDHAADLGGGTDSRRLARSVGRWR